ncbi:GNAT family N-acetyltransferase [Kribbella sp. NPDC050124]|uniref:GNAT family N-acetyltransferase n=1 Tax=Kribbella sp. NPDC050124 TaxID=3364114 RepID=UPI00378BD034
MDVTVRRAAATDWKALAAIDAIAAAGDAARAEAIRRCCEQGLVLTAEDASQRLVGYVTVEYTFFDQGFVTMLMVDANARRQGIGRRLLHAAKTTCTTPKLFTSTNVSNLPMQQLLQRTGWSATGLLHGLDESDPELFYLCDF